MLFWLHEKPIFITFVKQSCYLGANDELKKPALSKMVLSLFPKHICKFKRIAFRLVKSDINGTVKHDREFKYGIQGALFLSLGEKKTNKRRVAVRTSTHPHFM